MVDEEVAMATPTEVWAVGAGYEAYVGRWSRLVAKGVGPPRRRRPPVRSQGGRRRGPVP